MKIRKLLAIFLAMSMIVSLMLSAVSCDDLLDDLLEEPETETELEEKTSKDEEKTKDKAQDETHDETQDETEGTTKKNDETTTEANTSNGGNNLEVVAYDGSEVTIKFYHTMGQNLRDVLDKYIAEFNKMYPNIHIQHSQVGAYEDVREQIKSELTVGNQPNLAYCYPDHVALYNITGKVIKLNGYIESNLQVMDANGNYTTFGLTEEQISDYISAFYDEGATYDSEGTMYTLPISKSTELLYYNKTFFEEHGLMVPTTWEEMLQLCAKIKTINPSSTPFGYDSESNWFINMTAQLGSEYTSLERGNNFKFDNDLNKNFVKEFREWYQKGYVITQEIYGAYISEPFKYGDVYMSVSSSAGSNHMRSDFEVGIAPIPQMDVNNPKTIHQGPSLCMFDTGDSQEAAATWLFMKFLSTDSEFQAEFSMASGYMPVVKSATEIPQYVEFLNNADGYENIRALAIRASLEQADSYYTLPSFNGMEVARYEVGKIMQLCFTSTDKDIDDYIDWVFEMAVKECEYQS